jgi:long-chain-fatty-acid--CoA ligase ACSBG
MNTTIVSKFTELKGVEVPALFTYDKEFKTNKVISWDEYVRQSLNFGRYMKKNAIGNVAIHAFNCPEWFYSAMGSLSIKRYFCGIYNTNRDEQCIHVLKKGECDMLVVENYGILVDYYKNVIDQLVTANIKVIVINRPDQFVPLDQHELLTNLNITFWDQLDLLNDGLYHDVMVDTNSITPDDICTLIFTSGTTGDPKAVEITHQNIMTSVGGVIERFNIRYMEERIVSYLPLSHIAGQALDLYMPILCASQVHFARSDALKGSLKDTLLAVRPTVFLGVPRVWEKFREGLLKVSEKSYSGSFKRRLLGRVMRLVKGVEYYYNTSDDWLLLGILYIPSLITSAVTQKIKEAIGLDQCRYFATGAAPISKEVLEYFASIGIKILEIYGMSETAGIITVSDPISSLRGSCGTPISGVEVMIDENNNEIMVRGKNIFKGYHNPNGFDEKVEQPTGINSLNFLHTGDCGYLDETGHLYITGRIKDLLITAGGENIPPTLIEDKIKSLTHIPCQYLLIGDKKKFLTLLVFCTGEENKTDIMANISQAIKEYNANYAISNSQKVQKFKIIYNELTVENGFMTPTMKIKRNEVVRRYETEIEQMYSADD